jgi:hypothetical protein
MFDFPYEMNESFFDAINGPLFGEDLAAVKELYDPARYPYPEDLGSFSIWWWMNTRITTDGEQPPPAPPAPPPPAPGAPPAPAPAPPPPPPPVHHLW